MKHYLLLFLLLAGMLHADGCDTKRFSLNAYQNHGASLTLMDLLRDVTQTCNISVVFEDKRARERLSQPLDMVNIRDYTLPELFTFIFDEHNLFYQYDTQKAMLRVSYYNTVNYNVDYINMSELTTQSTKSISVGAGSSNTGTTGTNGGIATNVSNTAGTTGTSGTTGGSSGSNNDMTTVTATSTFTFWKELHDHIQEILKIDEEYSDAYNKTLINRDATVVTVSGTKRQLNSVEQYIAALKKRMHAQVMVEAHLIELTYNDYSSIGVNWSKFSLGFNGSYINSFNNTGAAHPYSFGINFDSAGLIDFLKTYGDVEVLSNPKVLTLSNQPAVINVGKQLSYLYSSGAITTTTTGAPSAATTSTLGSVFVGLTLNIVPEVTEDGYIIMRINPVTSELLTDSELSSSSQTVQTSTNRVMPPDTRVKQMTSIVKVKDAQKVLIGGLIEKKTYKNDTKVPLFGDIPYLGRLFNNTTNVTRKSELFILLTPTLVKGDVFPSIDDTLLKRFN